MPTEFVAQNGATIDGSTPIAAAGKVVASGRGLSKSTKIAKRRETIKLTLHATESGMFSTRLELMFTPSRGKEALEVADCEVQEVVTYPSELATTAPPLMN
jgi:hypothetical protein